ncbi:MAG: proton-conducting transporter membrane subunit [Sulfolobales archaeon]
MALLPVDQVLLIFSILMGFSLSIPLAEMLGVDKRTSKYISIAGLVIALATVLISPPSGSVSIISGFLSNVDAISYPIAIAILLGGIIGIVSLPVEATDSAHPYLSMILMGVLASIMLVMARDPVAIIASWTLLSVTTFAAVALARDRESLEASVRYSIVGAIASQLLIIGVAFSTPYMFPAVLAQQQSLLYVVGLIAIAFTMIAIGFKLGAAPSHSWVPDVYGKASPYVVSVISGSLKLGVVGLAVYVLSYLGPISPGMLSVVIFMSVASMLIGSILPLTQTNAQRILAYSSIAHMGFIFIGLSVLAVSHDNPHAYRLALLGVVFHTLAYALGKSGVFAALNYIRRYSGGLELDVIRSSTAKDPKLTFSLSVHLLNLIGVPPLPGFWGKLFLFMAAAQNLRGLYIGQIPWLVILGIAASVISVYYYLNILRASVAGSSVGGNRDPDLWASYASATISIILGVFMYILSYYV